MTENSHWTVRRSRSYSSGALNTTYQYPIEWQTQRGRPHIAQLEYTANRPHQADTMRLWGQVEGVRETSRASWLGSGSLQLITSNLGLHGVRLFCSRCNATRSVTGLRGFPLASVRPKLLHVGAANSKALTGCTRRQPRLKAMIHSLS